MNHGFKLHPDGTLEIIMPKGKKVGRVLVIEAGTPNMTLMYPDKNAMAYDEFIKTMDMAIEATNTQDKYSRGLRNGFRYAKSVATGEEPDFEALPSAEPEPAIPLSWIEGQIKWLKSLDNAFSTLTAVQISAMVNKWRGEQDD